jgi:hypothetical protein
MISIPRPGSVPGNRLRAAIIPFSVAGPFRIFAECTAGFKRIANSREFHSAKSGLASSFGGLAGIAAPGAGREPKKTSWPKNRLLGRFRKSCHNNKEEKLVNGSELRIVTTFLHHPRSGNPRSTISLFSVQYRRPFILTSGARAA